MTWRRDMWTAVLTAMLALALAMPAAAVTYDVVYVRQPRFGNNTNTTWPEVAHPARIDPGADLMLLHPDGSQEVLVAGGVGAVTDPFVSFDGQWVYYSLFYDVRPSQGYNSQRGLPWGGADIFRINLQSRAIEQLTFQEFTPNTGAGHFDESNPVDPGSQYDRLGYGILNLGPAPVAGGRVAFSSNRNGFVPPRGLTSPTMQLYVMDADGSNVTQIAPMNIGSALHPTPLRDGRLLFSTLETQGLRDDRMWGIWSIWPDGRHWDPVVSAFRSGQAFHFMTQLSNTDLVVVDYYNLNNNGFGALYRLPVNPPAGTPRFYSAFPDENPSIQQTVGGGFSYPFSMSFTPWGLHSITPFTHGNDEAAPVGSGGTRVGKFTHPSGAPNNDLLVVWSPGPCNDLNRPTTTPYYDAGLYLIAGGNVVTNPNQLVLLKNDPNYNEAWPRAVVPYSAIHGVAEPFEFDWLPNDGSEHAALPAGTPYGLVGSSSVYKRESFPGFVPSWSDTFDGLDAFNTSENGQSSNWEWQGGDAGRYADSDIWAMRIVGMEPNTHRSYGPNGGPSGGSRFYSHAGEKLRILGEIPLRKSGAGGQPLLDAEGNPDTSFLVKIPADTPFTFQTIDRRGMVLNVAQTWHQVRPGEVRNDCGGCHAHSQQPLAFEGTAAGQPGYPIADLAATTPLLSRDAQGNPSLRTVAAPQVTVEFLRDIRPLLQRSCVPCHTKNNPTPPGALVLDDYTNPGSEVPGDYARLADDRGADWGHPPLVGVWRQTNASRYIRMFQSRRSLLMWKLWGQRLDGWTNADHPTESVSGNAATLPSGAQINQADLDFTGQMMPPPGSGVPPLSDDEKMLFARWIDLGCPIDWDESAYGWFLDDLRPALDVSLPRAGANDGPLTLLRLGAADGHSGVDWSSLSITASVAVNGRAAGIELADLAGSGGDGIRTLTVNPPIAALADARFDVEIADVQGNVTRVARRFSVQGVAASPTATVPPPTPTPTATRTFTVPPTATATASRTATSTATATAATPVAVSGDIRYFRDDRPVAGAVVAGATSATNGTYNLIGNLGSPLALSPQRSGGQRGAVSALDAAWVLQTVAGQRQLDTYERLACDVTGNGSLSTLDATRILQLAVGMATPFPAAEMCGSDWLFFPDLAGGPPPSAVMPSFAGGVCQPGAIVHTPLTGPASAQRFRSAVLGDCTGNWQPSGGASLTRRTSSATVTATRPRRARNQLRLPIRIDGDAFSAVELTLRADPSLTLRDIRLPHRLGAAVQFASRGDGTWTVALASPRPLDRLRLIAVFAGSDRSATAQLVSARVDEQP